MIRSQLPEPDINWLSQHAEACRLKCLFILQDEYRSERHVAMRAGLDASIWYKGSYKPVIEVMKEIERSLPSSQIFEQWEYRRYQAVMRVTRELSALDARMLLVGSGFSEQTEETLSECAAQSVEEAWQALYGE